VPSAKRGFVEIAQPAINIVILFGYFGAQGWGAPSEQNQWLAKKSESESFRGFPWRSAREFPTFEGAEVLQTKNGGAGSLQVAARELRMNGTFHLASAGAEYGRCRCVYPATALVSGLCCYEGGRHGFRASYRRLGLGRPRQLDACGCSRWHQKPRPVILDELVLFDTAVRRVPHVLTKVSGAPAASPSARSSSLKIWRAAALRNSSANFHTSGRRPNGHSDADEKLPRVQPGGLACMIRRGIS
jgi:hypothetical protein